MSFELPMIISYLSAIIILYLLGWMLLSPLKWLLKTIFWSILGIVSLTLTNLIGSFIGISISVNVFTCLVSGILGVPGVAMLLIIQAIV